MKTSEKDMTTLELANAAEEALGYNLVWLNDKLDLWIRQNDKDTIDRLKEINQAWRYVVRIATRLDTKVK